MDPFAHVHRKLWVAHPTLGTEHYRAVHWIALSWHTDHLQSSMQMALAHAPAPLARLMSEHPRTGKVISDHRAITIT